MEKDLPDTHTSYEIRKTGGDEYYIVALTRKGHSENLYVKGKLLTFDDKEGARKYVTRITDQTQRSR